MITSSDSNAASETLSSEFLLSYCQSESLSEEGLRELFERHGVKPNSNNHVEDFHRVFFRLCLRGKITEGIIRCFLEYFPTAIKFHENGVTPLHAVCMNDERVSVNIVQLLIDAAPAAVRSVDSKGMGVFHFLCSKVDEASALEILKFLIEKYPEGVRHVDDFGCLPIHYVSKWRSPEFCRVLVEAYPGSEQIPDDNNMLPLVGACCKNTLATVEYFYKLDPDAIYHTVTADVLHPIHLAIGQMYHRSNPIAAVEIVKFFLDCDPNLSAHMIEGELSLLSFACQTQMLADQSNVDSNIEAGIQIIKMIFDSHPEAIEHDSIASDVHHWNQHVQTLINNELVYARQARDHRQMTTPDDNGQLPLHIALQNNVRLGSIKLLVKGNPPAIQSSDNQGSLPLHLACQNHDSIGVIEYLVGLDPSTLEAVDVDNNTALHYACSNAKYETIAMLLEKYDAVSISRKNADGKLPLDLLCESNEVRDRESIEYMESVFRLLRAYPETLMNYNVHMNQRGASASGDCSTQNGKKRKLAVD